MRIRRALKSKITSQNSAITKLPVFTFDYKIYSEEKLLGKHFFVRFSFKCSSVMPPNQLKIDSCGNDVGGSSHDININVSKLMKF